MEPGTQKCKSKKGLLIIRECGAPAIEVCSRCNIPLCSEHMVSTPDGITCPECYESSGETTANDRNQPQSMKRFRRRRSYYNDYGYRPHYYHHNRYFNDQDRQTVDSRAENLSGKETMMLTPEQIAAAEAAEAAGTGDSFADEDGPDSFDSMES